MWRIENSVNCWNTLARAISSQAKPETALKVQRLGAESQVDSNCTHERGAPFQGDDIVRTVAITNNRKLQKHRIKSRCDNILHRTAAVNEYSTRYSEAISSNQRTKPADWRKQSSGNKQGSSGRLDDWPGSWEVIVDPAMCKNLFTPPGGASSDDITRLSVGQGTTPGDYLSTREVVLQRLAREVYQERLDFGVAREQARKDLPLSTYTEAYWKIDLHNLLHFLSLRLDPHAQLEIRQYAEAIASYVKHICPITWEAFVNYRLEATTLTANDQYVMKSLIGYKLPMPRNREAFDACQMQIWGKEPKSREREECWDKLLKLGMVTEDEND